MRLEDVGMLCPRSLPQYHLLLHLAPFDYRVLRHPGGRFKGTWKLDQLRLVLLGGAGICAFALSIFVAI